MRISDWSSDVCSSDLAHGRAGGGLVVNIRHEMPDGPLFVPGSDGARINETVQPDGDEPVITKNFPNSFRETGLNDLLKEKGLEEVVIVGAMSHMCVDATVRAANELGHKRLEWRGVGKEGVSKCISRWTQYI